MRIRAIGNVLVWVLWMLLFANPAQLSADTAQYFYDPLGRLVGVVDGQGNIATYHYDSVGNLLSITRESVTAPTITSVSPSSIQAGTTVTMTVTGTGFLTSSVVFPNPDLAPSILFVSGTTITNIPKGSRIISTSV